MTEPTESAAPAIAPRPEQEPSQGPDDATGRSGIAAAGAAADATSVRPSDATSVRPSDETALGMVAADPTRADATEADTTPAGAPEAEATRPTPDPSPSSSGARAPSPGPAGAPHPRRPVPVPRPPARPGAPVATPRPLPRPPHAVPHPPTASPHDVQESAEAAAWGRVDEDGTVWVREAAGERSVGQYPGADTSEALAFYVRRFLELHAQVNLLEARLPQLSTKEAEHTLASLTEAVAAPAAVGDLDGLRARLEDVRGQADQRRAEASTARRAARQRALEARTAIVEQVEQIAAADPAKTQWREAGDRLHALLDEWKDAQRHGPRLDRAAEDALWKRFAHARSAFDRGRRQYFAEADKRRTEAKAAKEDLVAEAERLASSTDWSATAAAYRGLMERWKAAGRASQRDDDALWERFRAAQDTFFTARNSAHSASDAEFAQNLTAKLALLDEAEALLPVTDLGRARAGLRSVQDRWDAIGKVPRGDVQRIEARLRAVEHAVRDAQQATWERTNPDTRARAQGALAQLEDSIASLESGLAAARKAGDAVAEAEASAALETRRAWLAQVRRTANDPG